jgi:hypothetical protein
MHSRRRAAHPKPLAVNKAHVLVYLPLRGAVMPLQEANQVLGEREPYVLMPLRERRPLVRRATQEQAAS